MFKKFIDNITLTSNQQDDAKKKYTGVCETLYKHYYGDGTYDSSKQFLFGSYKTKTNVRPLTSDQDVDVLFKISQSTFDKYDAYKSNGQSALLQDVRNALKDKYTTTDTIKAWGKVVLVEFSENHHNVELLPALELEDGTFKIPNTEGEGSWEIFDPRAETAKFDNSNSSTSGLTRDLAKMLKAWAHNTTSMSYPSYKRLDDIIAFLEAFYSEGEDVDNYGNVVFGFFDYMRTRCSDDIESYIKTAYSRAQKALQYKDDGKEIEASEEWIKIFGSEFPKATKNKEESRSESISTNPSRPWLDFLKMK